MTKNDILDNLITKVKDSYTENELAIGYLRYEALRKLSPLAFQSVHQRNLDGTNFDSIIDQLILLKK